MVKINALPPQGFFFLPIFSPAVGFLRQG